MPLSHADPSVCPTVWLQFAGGEPVVSLLATAMGRSTTSLVAPGTKRAALSALKELRGLAYKELPQQDDLLNTAEELWVSDRPTDWDDAQARISEVANAAVARRARASSGPALPSFAPQSGLPPQSGVAPQTVTAAAFGAAVKSAIESRDKYKPAIASAAQRDLNLAVHAEVIEPLSDPAFIDAERALGSQTSRGTDMNAELRRFCALGQHQAHAAGAFLASCGTRMCDTTGGLPPSINLLRTCVLAALKHFGELARGGSMRRGMCSVGAKSVAVAMEGVLVGQTEFPAFVKLFGGIVPAQSINTLGSDGAGRDGSIGSRTDIQKALRVWARATLLAHSIIFDLRGPPLNDFGVEAFLGEAEHITPERLMRALKEAFDILSREFIAYRSSLSAPPPDPARAILSAHAALKVLEHEQLTIAIVGAARSDSAKDKEDDRLKKLEKELAENRALLGQLKRRNDQPAGARSPPATRSWYSAPDTRHLMLGT